jgi:AmmeMemoRadiSam system protein B/AmmeMemoRadiSam system protein A
MIALTEQQERRIHHAASAMVAAAVNRRPVRLPDGILGGTAPQTIMGAFVSLKRRGRLRGCCGVFGVPMTLGDAISQAARRTATEDVRLPPVSPGELSYLHLEVWLLDGPKPVTSQGAARVAEVIIGRHGLIIRRGEASGLLLPGVAVENGYDAEAFLEQVCLKASLPPTAWKETDTSLATFEGHAIAGPFDPRIASEAIATPSTFLNVAQVARLSEHCRENILALVQGTMPSCFSQGCADGTVHGMSVAVHLSDDSEILRISRLSLRPGLPLQSTLYNLAEAVARIVGQRGISPQQLAELQVALTLLWDSAMHGTVMEPDFDGLDPTKRALLVLEGAKWAWVYNPQLSAKDLLLTAAREAQVKNPDAALVLSLAVESTEASTIVAEVPRPQAGPKIRPSAVAGAFYPAEAQALWKLVDELLGDAGQRPDPWPAILVPHAGLNFSGRIAAAVFRRVAIPDVVLILAPKHTRTGMEWAVTPHEAWALPGASVASDPALASELAATIPDLSLDALAHEKEHSIEVQLPLLARLAPSARVVGITLGAATLEQCLRFASGLAEGLRQRADNPLLVISSDLNHYASDVETRRLDAIALAALERLDPGEVYARISRHKISMCGLLPAVIVLETLRQLGTLRTSERVGYATSAEVSGDLARVVGYAGMLFG